MPLVDVTFASTVPDDELRWLTKQLPDLVAEAVDCPEEPWDGPPNPGDIDIRFHPRHDCDVGYLRLVIEIRTKLFQSRLEDKQRRADLVRDRLIEAGLEQVGVWLILAEGAWSQTRDAGAPTTIRRTCSVLRGAFWSGIACSNVPYASGSVAACRGP